MMKLLGKLLIAPFSIKDKVYKDKSWYIFCFLYAMEWCCLILVLLLSLKAFGINIIVTLIGNDISEKEIPYIIENTDNFLLISICVALVLLIFYIFNKHTQIVFCDTNYLKYLAESWRKNIKEEEKKQFISEELSKYYDNTPKLMKLYDQVMPISQVKLENEMCIDTLFQLIILSVENKKQSLHDELIKKLQHFYEKNIDYFDQKLAQDKQDTYITSSVDRFYEYIYSNSIKEMDYRQNISALNFLQNVHRVDLYKRFLTQQDISLKVKQRIILLSFENNLCVKELNVLKTDTDIDVQIRNFIDFFINEAEHKGTTPVDLYSSSSMSNIPEVGTV